MRQHAISYLKLAEMAAPELRRATQLIWLAQLEAEHANMHAALRWCLEGNRDSEYGLRLAVALGHFWTLHNHYTEGRRWLELALEGGGNASKLLRSEALHYLSACALSLADYAQGVAW